MSRDTCVKCTYSCNKRSNIQTQVLDENFSRTNEMYSVKNECYTYELSFLTQPEMDKHLGSQSQLSIKSGETE